MKNLFDNLKFNAIFKTCIVEKSQGGIETDFILPSFLCYANRENHYATNKQSS